MQNAENRGYTIIFITKSAIILFIRVQRFSAPILLDKGEQQMKAKKKIALISAVSALLLAGVAAITVIIHVIKDPTVLKQEAEDELKSFQFETYENLVFDCKVPDIEADKLYELKIDRDPKWADLERGKELLCKMSESFFGINLGSNEIKQDERNEHKLLYDHYLSKEKVGNEESQDGSSMLFSSHTFILADHNELRSIRFQKDVEACLPFIDIRNISSSEKITLNGKEIDLSEFVRKSEEEISKCCTGVFNEGETIRPYDAIKLRSMTDNSEYITLRFSHVIEGVEYNEDGFGGNDEGNIPLPSFVTVEMNDEGKIASIYNPFYYQITDKKEINKIIPLSKANDHLSEVLAPYLEYKVKNIDLKYVSVTNYLEKSGPVKLMWCYTLDEYGGGYGDPTNFFLKKTAFVDAVSGDVYLVDAKDRTSEIQENDN